MIHIKKLNILALSLVLALFVGLSGVSAQEASPSPAGNVTITEDNDKTITKTRTTTIDKSMHDSQKVWVDCYQEAKNSPENKPDSDQDGDQDQDQDVKQDDISQNPSPSGSPSAVQTVTSDQDQDQTQNQTSDQTTDQSSTITQENCDITVNNGDTRPFPSFSPSVTNITNVTNPAPAVFTTTVPKAAPATGRG